MAWSDVFAGIGGGLQGGLSAYEWLNDIKDRDAREEERRRDKAEQRARDQAAAQRLERQDVAGLLDAVGPGGTIGKATAERARAAGLEDIVEWTPGRMASETVAGGILPPLAEGYRRKDPGATARENAGIDEQVAQQRKDIEIDTAIGSLADPYAQEAARFQRKTGINVPISSLIPLDEQNARAAAKAAAEQASEIDTYEKKKRIDRQYDAPASDPIVEVEIVDEQGNEVIRYLPQSQVRGQTFKKKPKAGRPPIGQERAALGFFNRVALANQDMLAVEDEIANLGGVDQLRMKYGYNWIQSPVMQKYNQAKKVLTEARLRKESGAAIHKDEYAKDEEMGAIQPGDFDETLLEQKRRYRQGIADGLQIQSGSAFDEYYGEGASEGYRQGRQMPPVSRGTVTQAPRPMSSHEPTSTGAQPSTSQYRPGQRVNLANGKVVTITSINPDGTFEYR